MVESDGETREEVGNVTMGRDSWNGENLLQLADDDVHKSTEDAVACTYTTVKRST